MGKFFQPRQRANEAGYDIDPIGRRSFMRGYQDGYGHSSSPPFPPRPTAYAKGYEAGKTDVEALLKDSAEQKQIDKAVSALRGSLKNARRTTTRRLDDAGMPEDMQGNDGKDWG